MFSLDLLCAVPPCGPYSTQIPFGGLFGDGFYYDAALLIEALECRGQGRPLLFPLSSWPLITRPRQTSSSAWALSSDRAWAGLQASWPYNSPSKSCYPNPQTDRRVLMTSHICQCLSILVTYRFPRPFICPRYVPRSIGRRNVASLNTGGFVFPTFNGMMKIEQS